MNRLLFQRTVVVPLLCAMLLCARAGQIEPRFEKDISCIQAERAQTDRLLQAARLHVLSCTPEWLAFMKTYRRSSDVVETALLGFLDDSAQTPQAFMANALKKDSWKKPMDRPLSFVVFLKLRTARDWFRINYVRLHERSLDLEVDQLCPTAADELKEAATAVLEIPLGPLTPGSFHYMTWMNAGPYTKTPPDHPQGWEYADVSRFQAGASGCTIVDPASNKEPRRREPPIRKSEFLTEAQLDAALERLRSAKFPMSRSKIYDLVGLSKEQRNNFATLQNCADKTALVMHDLTRDGIKHILEIRGQKGDLDFKADAASTLIYYRDGDRKYTLFDSRIGLDD
jgi:hypothetical protein